MTFHVERIDHVVLRVRNLAAMVAFYERALGFTTVRRLDRLKLVQMRAGASMLDLIDKERGDAEADKHCNMDHLCFRVEPFDRDAIAARLSPLGITLGETVERFGAEGTGPSVYFDDPEGNQIELKGPASSGMPIEDAVGGMPPGGAAQ